MDVGFLQKIYKEVFYDGEKVIVIDVNDKFYWGVLVNTDTHLILCKGEKVERIEWNKVRFIAQDSFDLRFVRCAYPGERELNQMMLDGIRRLLRNESKNTKERGSIYGGFSGAHGTVLRGGDPFEIEARAMLLNPGNDAPVYWNLWGIETVVLQQPGRLGLLWDLGTVFECERR